MGWWVRWTQQRATRAGRKGAENHGVRFVAQRVGVRSLTGQPATTAPWEGLRRQPKLGRPGSTRYGHRHVVEVLPRAGTRRAC